MITLKLGLYGRLQSNLTLPLFEGKTKKQIHTEGRLFET